MLTGSDQQVVGAIDIAKDKDILWMGTRSNQSPLASDIVVSTQLYVWDDVFTDYQSYRQYPSLAGAGAVRALHG